jgi:hypothetical protein
MDPDSRRSLSSAHDALSVLVYLTAASALVAVLLQLVLAQLNHLGLGFGRDLIPNFSRLGLVLRALMGGSLLALSVAPAPGVRGPALAGGGLLLSGAAWSFSLPVIIGLVSKGEAEADWMRLVPALGPVLMSSGVLCLLVTVRRTEPLLERHTQPWLWAVPGALVAANLAAALLRPLSDPRRALTGWLPHYLSQAVLLAGAVAVVVYLRQVLREWQPAEEPRVTEGIDPRHLRALLGLFGTALAVQSPAGGSVLGSGLAAVVALGGVVCIASAMRARPGWIAALAGAVIVLGVVAWPAVAVVGLLLRGKIGG